MFSFCERTFLIWYEPIWSSWCHWVGAATWPRPLRPLRPLRSLRPLRPLHPLRPLPPLRDQGVVVQLLISNPSTPQLFSKRTCCFFSFKAEAHAVGKKWHNISERCTRWKHSRVQPVGCKVVSNRCLRHGRSDSYSCFFKREAYAAESAMALYHRHWMVQRRARV